jgi:hypothetical protein
MAALIRTSTPTLPSPWKGEGRTAALIRTSTPTLPSPWKGEGRTAGLYAGPASGNRTGGRSPGA